MSVNQVPAVSLSGCLALIRHFGPGYRDHCHKMTEACEIIGIRRVQRQLSRDRGGCDHQIDCPAAGFPACRDHGCRHPSVRTGGVRVKWDRIELVLSALPRKVRAASTKTPTATTTSVVSGTPWMSLSSGPSQPIVPQS